jgi:DNA polymerase
MAGLSSAQGIHIEIKTRSVCDRRKVDPWTYAANWSTGVWVVGYAIGGDEVRLWHPRDPVPQELIDAIAGGLPIISYDAPFQRAMLTNVIGPQYGWPIPPLEQWLCTAAMAAAINLPRGLDEAAEAKGIAERKDREAKSLLRKMAQPRSKTHVLCFRCGKMTCDHHEMFKTSLVWWDDAEDRARLDSYSCRTYAPSAPCSQRCSRYPNRIAKIGCASKLPMTASSSPKSPSL